MILKLRRDIWIIVYAILLTFCNHMPEAAPITAVEGQSASFDFAISAGDPVIIYVSHSSSNNTLFVMSGTGAVLVVDDRVTTHAGTTRSRVIFTLTGLTRADAGVYKATINTVEKGSQELKIIGKPRKPTILDIGIPALGEDHTIRCSATSTSTAGIPGLVMSYQWYRNDGAVSTGGRYTIKNNELTISSVVRTDVSDSFQCEAWEDEAAKSEKSNQHSIPEPAYGPDSVTFTPSTTTYTPVENTSISVITCTAQCGPDCSYSWRKDGQTSPVSGTAELSFSQIKRNQAGQYQCTVTNNGRSTSASSVKLTISVYYGPDSVIFTPSTTTYTPVENSSISVITCIAQCGPDCSYSWRKDGQTSPASGTAELSFSQIKRNQAGQYQCTVTNNGRSTSASSVKINISVYYPPDGPPVIQNYVDGSTYTVIEGVSQTLTCTISGGVPPATLSWTCPGVSDIKSSSSGDTISRRVTWSATRHEDGDLCTCKSQHTATNWFRSAHSVVHVEYQPTISDFSDRKIIKGNKLSVPCSASGAPPPSYTWTRFSDSNFQQSGSTLILDNIQTEYADDFACHGSNTMNPTVGSSIQGHDSKLLNIDVLFPPEVKPFSSVLHVVLGRTLRAKCNASGNPSPTYQWMRGKDSVTWNTAELEIASVAKIDADTYTCMATNLMDPTPTEGTSQSGTDSKDLIVDVQYIAIVSDLVMLNARDNEINEGEKLILRCRVDGNPAPTITIKFAPSDSVLSELPAGLVLTYTKQQAECVDQGNYGCVAHNFLNGASNPESQIEVTVKCTPRFDYRQTEVTREYSSVGQNVTFHLYLISSPPPTQIRWFKDNGKELTDGVVKYALYSALKIFVSNNDVFGNYSAVVTYNSKQFLFNYFLIPRGPESKETNQNEELNAGLIVGCLGGGIVIGALTVVVVLVMKRRGTLVTRATSNTAGLYDNLASGEDRTTTYSALQKNEQLSASKVKSSAYESIELEQTTNCGDLNPRTSEGKTDKGIYENTFIP